MKPLTLLLLVLQVTLMGAGCKDKPEPPQAREVVLMTHDSFSVSDEVIAAFENANHAKVRFLKAEDAGAALNKAILSKNNPLADVFFGVDNTFLSRALEAGLFVSYAPPQLQHIPAHLKLDPQNRLLPVDFGDVCLNWDKAWFKERQMSPPSSLEDLIEPGFKDLTVVENPATSSPGLAFLLATIARFGEDGYLDYWKSLKANNVLIASGWNDAYWGHFTAASEGVRPVVVSYATSPPVEVLFAEKPLDEAPTAAVAGPGTAFRQIEFIGVFKGAKHPHLARKLVDFMLDKPFQEDIPLQMFVFPANQTAALPEVFVKYAVQADQPAAMAPKKIADMREKWIRDWSELMLR